MSSYFRRLLSGSRIVATYADSKYPVEISANGAVSVPDTKVFLQQPAVKDQIAAVTKIREEIERQEHAERP